MEHKKILLDTNILLDYLQQRKDFEASEKIINLCAQEKIQGFIAAHSIPDIFYILRKTYPSESDRRRIIIDFIKILSIDALTEEKIYFALANEDFKDFEDCLQAQSAEFVNADFIITRNPKDFELSKVPVVSPEEFLEELSKQK